MQRPSAMCACIRTFLVNADGFEAGFVCCSTSPPVCVCECAHMCTGTRCSADRNQINCRLLHSTQAVFIEYYLLELAYLTCGSLILCAVRRDISTARGVFHQVQSSPKLHQLDGISGLHYGIAAHGLQYRKTFAGGANKPE